MSLRDLNWRKGFFRLWLLASSIWVIVFGMVVVYPSAIRYIESLNAVQEFDHSKDKAKIEIDPAKLQWTGQTKAEADASGQVVPTEAEIMPGKGVPIILPNGEIVPDSGAEITPPKEQQQPDISGYTIEEIYKAAGKGVPESVKHISGYTVGELTKIAEAELRNRGKDKNAEPDLSQYTNEELLKMSGFIPVDKITGNKLTADEFMDKKKEKDQIEYVTTEKWYEVNRIAKSKESRKKDLLVCSGMTFLPPVIALVLGIGVMWVFSGFVPKQNK